MSPHAQVADGMLSSSRRDPHLRRAPSTSPCAGQRGFTLIELIVVMALIAVVALAAAQFLGLTTRLYTSTTVRQQLLGTARVALLRMTREIMAADRVASADASSFRFLGAGGADITFAQSGSQVLRNSDPLLDNAAELAFDYWDSTGASLSVPVPDPSQSVWRTRVRVTVARLGQSVTLQAEAYLRKGG